jgi:hypothetical protein
LARLLIWRLHSLLATTGWSSFLPLTVPERAPQLRVALAPFDVGPDQLAMPGAAADDRFLKAIALRWADLRDSYYECLLRVRCSSSMSFPARRGRRLRNG